MEGNRRVWTMMPGRPSSSPVLQCKIRCGSPKGTPADIVQTYRDAARKILQDPKFQKDLQKKLGGYPQYVGKEAKQAFDQALKVPTQVHELAQEMA